MASFRDARSWLRPFAVWATVMLLGACASAPAAPEATETRDARLTRAEVVEHARAYARHRWSASPRNAFHGEDRFGNRIDTPDAAGTDLATGWRADGEPNQGVAYQWGGFSSIAEFEAGVAEGKWAGHLPTDGRSFYTPAAVGVDCSGLIARVWGLPRKESTRSLPRICRELRSYDDLLPGDILNLRDRHTMLFVAWEDAARSRLRVIEATVREGRVHESIHVRRELEQRGYVPLRYPRLAD